MPPLYELAEAIRGVLARLDDIDGELPPGLSTDLDALQMAFEEKAENICRYRVGLCAAAEGIDAEIRRLTAMRDGHIRRAEWLKSYLFAAMQSLGLERLDTKLFKLWIQKNGRPTIECAGSDSPEGYQRVVVSFDGEKAYEDWKAGKPLPPEIVVREGYHLRIK
jgi:hypothetical protein